LRGEDPAHCVTSAVTQGNGVVAAAAFTTAVVHYTVTSAVAEGDCVGEAASAVAIELSPNLE
jgi:hypothetical protein